MNPEAGQVEHLDLIQGVVDRLSRNSFAIKSAATATTAALVAFMADTESPMATAGIAVFPLLLLDAFFLERERGFRGLYDSVRRSSPPEHGHDGYFTMGVPAAGLGHGLLRAVSSASLSLFYAGLIMLTGVSALFTLI